MLKGFKIRLFPTKEQEEKLWKSVGTARWVWNWGLNFRIELYKNEGKSIGSYDLKKEFTKVRNSEGMEWLKEVSAKVASTAIFDLDEAYKAFYRIAKKGKKAGFPKFKSRGKSKPSFGLDAQTVIFYKDGVQLQKIGHVKYKSELGPLRDIPDLKIYNTRIQHTQNDKWILSFSTEIPEQVLKLHSYSVGIDLGVKTLAVVSCQGKFYKAKNMNRSYKLVRLEKQLKHHQRALSRKKKASKNRKKALKKVQKTYSRISNIRHDYTHKITTKVVNMLPQRIVIEDLNVQGMMKNRRLAKAVSQQNFYKFRSQLEYKCKERGIELKVADKFFPSSKTCSNCGRVKQELKLSDRIYKCECGLVLDRDENASRNLEKVV
jgi:putative transposase